MIACSNMQGGQNAFICKKILYISIVFCYGIEPGKQILDIRQGMNACSALLRPLLPQL